ncbi:hypothetical protein MCEMSEM18_01300 [Comamonadaceae bacterium]
MPQTHPTLTPQLLRQLTLNPADHPRGVAHLSAASGLVRVGERLYVVADDEVHLGVFDSSAMHAPGALLRLLEGDLPHDKGARKKAKPDLETLAQLPPLPGHAHGALLALGSGSKPKRETAVLLPLDAQDNPAGEVGTVDLAPLYAPLRERFADLNIEGAFLLGNELLLLQRGNKGNALSACIRYEWNHIAPWLAGLQSQPPAPHDVQTMDLGEVDGVPLSLTDGTPLHGGAWAFCAVAESTDDSYHDGACVGSAIGIVTPDGQVKLQLLAGAPKVEGIAAQAADGGWQITLVTDPDEPRSPAQMLQTHWVL